MKGSDKWLFSQQRIKIGAFTKSVKDSINEQQDTMQDAVRP